MKTLRDVLEVLSGNTKVIVYLFDDYIFDSEVVAEFNYKQGYTGIVEFLEYELIQLNIRKNILEITIRG